MIIKSAATILISICLNCLAVYAGDPPVKGNPGEPKGAPSPEVKLIKKADRIIKKAEGISRKTDSRVSSKGKGSGKTTKPGVAEKGSLKKTIPGRSDYLLMQTGKSNSAQMVRFVLSNNRTLDPGYVMKLISIYMHESRREGINHDIAVCQMCLETGFLTFTGSVSRYQNNFCGIGATDAWSSGDWFRNMEDGVKAHIQHLKAYASHAPVVPPIVDPRFDLVPRGTVVTTQDLSGKWAMDPAYGTKIEGLIQKLHAK